MVNNPSVSNPTGSGTTPKPPTAAKVNNTTVSGGGSVAATAPKAPSAAKFGNTTISGGGNIIGFTPSPQTPAASAPADSSAPAAAASPSVPASNPSDPLVGARDYYKSGATGGNVDWDGQNVLLDGNAVTPSYIRNGTAYIPKSVADTAIEQHNKTNGITGNQGVLSKTDTKDNGRTEAALNDLLNRHDFSYNPETDPMYQQHVQNQTRYANDAMRYILNMNNSSPFGASASILGEALATRDNYIRGLSEDEKTYRDDAYTRYADKTQSMRDNLTDVRDVLTDFYNREYQANRDAINDTVADTKAEREAEQQEFENQQTLRTNDRLDKQSDAQVEAQNISNRKGTIDLDTYGAMNEAQLRAQQLENEGAAEENRQTMIDNDQTNAYNFGGYYDSMIRQDVRNLMNRLYTLDESTGQYLDANGVPVDPTVFEVLYQNAISAASAKGSQDAANGVAALPARPTVKKTA
ncbi:MAG: hypothetical protein ACI4EA_09200 [Candidatus Ornithomonoglobus sp.]